MAQLITLILPFPKCLPLLSAPTPTAQSPANSSSSPVVPMTGGGGHGEALLAQLSQGQLPTPSMDHTQGPGLHPFLLTFTTSPICR